ncbi:hypothetical protein PG985_014118 [Apiospora marii]|uniref:uncharacterized protein n=1 Tax=Apiospora marii TaxID=335849 RepID=UPI00312D5CE4
MQQVDSIVSCGKCRRALRTQLRSSPLRRATPPRFDDMGLLGASYARVQTALHTPGENTAPKAAGRFTQLPGLLQLDQAHFESTAQVQFAIHAN